MTIGPPYGGVPVQSSFQCSAAADCLPGQVCCAASDPTAHTGLEGSSCHVGPCPTDGGPQVCALAVECLPGDTCVSANAASLGLCTSIDAGADGSDASETGDIEINDAPSNG
jgi:hypothetical protein